MVVLAVCDPGSFRNKIFLELYEYMPDIIEIQIEEKSTPEGSELWVEAMPHESAMDLGKMVTLVEFFAGLERHREKLRKLRRPQVFWVSDKELTTLIRSAPGLYSWATTVVIEAGRSQDG